MTLPGGEQDPLTRMSQIPAFSHLKGNLFFFTTMNIIRLVRPEMDTILHSYLRHGLVLIPIVAGIWVMKLCISSRRAFARVRRLLIHSESGPS